jgi:hypothetical protein
MKVLLNPLCITITLLSLLSVACGSGGSGDSGNTPTQPDNGSDSVNQGLTGHLYIEGGLQYVYLIDAETGLVKYIPNTDWENQRERFPSGVSQFYSHPRTNSSAEFLMVAVHCQRANSDPLSEMLSCLAIQDYEGNYLSQFSIGDAVSGDAKLSPNGEYIALFRNLNQGGQGGEWFEIYTRSGDLVSDKNEDYKRFVWLNNGQILHTYNRHFIFTKNYSTERDYYISLPDVINGESIVGSYLGDFSPSPDNTQIAFTLYKKWGSSDIYGDALFIMNIDGSGIRKVAISMNESYQFIDDLTWSPDGRWIMVKEGYSPTQDSNALGTSGYLYAIPTEDIGKVLQLSIIDTERSSEVIAFQHDRNLTEPGEYMTTKALGSTRLHWIP